MGGWKRKPTVGCSGQWAAAPCAMRAASIQSLLGPHLVLRGVKDEDRPQETRNGAAKEKVPGGPHSADGAAAAARMATDSCNLCNLWRARLSQRKQMSRWCSVDVRH